MKEYSKKYVLNGYMCGSDKEVLDNIETCYEDDGLQKGKWRRIRYFKILSDFDGIGILESRNLLKDDGF